MTESMDEENNKVWTVSNENAAHLSSKCIQEISMNIKINNYEIIAVHENQ